MSRKLDITPVVLVNPQLTAAGLTGKIIGTLARPFIFALFAWWLVPLAFGFDVGFWQAVLFYCLVNYLLAGRSSFQPILKEHAPKDVKFANQSQTYRINSMEAK